MRGSGKIETDKKGRHRVRFEIRGKSKSFYLPKGASKQDAIEYREALRLQLAGTPNDPALGKRETLGTHAMEWLEERAKTHRDARGDRQRWDHYLSGTDIAGKDLGDLRPTDMYEFGRGLVSRKNERRGGVISRQTAKNIWNTVRAVIRSAMRAQKLDAGLGAQLRAVELSLSPIEASGLVEMDERVVFLDRAEIARVFALDLTDEQRSVLTVALWAGLRQGELAGLRWERCMWDDGANGEIIVARSRQKATKGGMVARVPMLPPVRKALRARWVAAGRPASGFIWPVKKGKNKGGCYSDGYDWRWSDDHGEKFLTFGIRRRALVRPEVTFHAWRHTCGVGLLRGWWVEEGIVPERYTMTMVSRMLRHRSVGVTERFYANLSAADLPTNVNRSDDEDEGSGGANDGSEKPTKTEAENPGTGGYRKVPVPDLSSAFEPESPTNSGSEKPPRRFELRTYGLRTAPSNDESHSNHGGSSSEPVPKKVAGGTGSLREVAMDLLRAIRDGSPDLVELAARLALLAVEAEPTVTRHFEVEDGRVISAHTTITGAAPERSRPRAERSKRAMA